MRNIGEAKCNHIGRAIRSMLVGLLTAVFVAGIGVAVDAETIIRKDGRKLEGQIVEEDATHYTVRTTFGTFRIRKADVQEVTGRRAVSDNEREGREALSSGNYDVALARFTAALSEAQSPDDKKAISELIEEAKTAIRERELERFKSQLSTANLMIEQKQFAAAEDELESLLLANENEPAAAGVIREKLGELFMAKAAYYEDQINYAEAANAYLQAIERVPDAPEPYLKMAALVRNRGGEHQEVIDYYVKGIELALRTKSEEELIDEYYELGKSYLRKAMSESSPKPEDLASSVEAFLIVMRHRKDGYRFAATQMENAFAELSKTNYDMGALTGMLLATLDINPEANKVRWLLAEAYTKLREYQKAIDQMLIIEKNVKESGEPFPQEFYYRLGLAYLALPNPKMDAALDAFEKEIAQNKRNYLALIRAAEILSLQGLYPNALAYCEDAIRLRKERPEAYLVEADARMRRNDVGDTLEARARLRTALNLKDDFHQARIKLAELEIRRQREADVPNFDEATGLLFKVQLAIEQIPDAMRTEEDKKAYAESILWIAEIENDKSNHRQALDLVQKALDQYPGLARAYRVKADIHQQLDEYDKAKASYLKAIELNPGLAETYMEVGILCHTRLEEYNEAIKYFQAYKDHHGTEVTRVDRWINECRQAAARTSSGMAPTTGTAETVMPDAVTTAPTATP